MRIQFFFVKSKVPNRNCFFFQALVQDALSKLPNGKGTLDEITNLVRESQFLHPQADSTTLLKKTAISLTHFQRGHLEPTCSFDPETKQYKLHSHYPPPPPKIIPVC